MIAKTCRISAEYVNWYAEVLEAAAERYGLPASSAYAIGGAIVTAIAITIDLWVFKLAESRTKLRYGGSCTPRDAHVDDRCEGRAEGDSVFFGADNTPTASTTPETTPNGRPAPLSPRLLPQIKRLPLKGAGYRSVTAQAFFLALALALWSGDLVRLGRVAAVAGLCVRALPYLCKASVYRRDKRLRCELRPEDMHRGWGDMLVWTSIIYMVPAIYGLHAHQYGIAVLQTATSIGSTLFHLTRETMCFNLDNIFAQSLLITTLWGGILAAYEGVWGYVALLAAGFPLAAYFLVACGMPGLICCHPRGHKHGLIRRSNPNYDFFHMCWHIVSGLGTLVSIHFFEVYFPDKEAGGGWFAQFPDVPIVPATALAISALANMAANSQNILPVA